MKTYNKSEIMKTAWNLFRNFNYIYNTFAEALEQAWVYAKKEAAGMIAASEIKVNDTIKIEYGDYNNIAICTVTRIAGELRYGKYLGIVAIMQNGMEIEFFTDVNGKVQIVEGAKVAA